VAGKETKESLFWLKVIHRAEMVRAQLLTGIMQETNELAAILTQSRSTARRNLNAKERKRN